MSRFRLPKPTAFLLLCPLWAQPLSSQVVLLGRVTLPDSATVLVGAALIVHDLNGTQVAQEATGWDGRFRITLPSAGDFELLARRIGYRPLRIQVPGLVRGEERTLDLVMEEQPLQLEELTVTATDRCRMSHRDRDRFLDLWQRARSELGPHLSSGAQVAASLVLEVDGTEDGPVTLPSGYLVWNSGNRHPEIDSVAARSYWSHMTRTSPAELTARGYALLHSDGTLEYDVPNPDVVLDESFLGRYCFALEQGGRDNPGDIGIRFRPIEDVEFFTDIAGVLWLDAGTARIRSIDFDYRNLPRVPYAECVSANRPARPPSGELRLGPSCWDTFDRGVTRVPSTPEGTGGTLAFSAVEDRGWVMTAWTVRTRNETFMDRPAGFRIRPGRGAAEFCHDPRPPCQRVIVAVPRLAVSSGAVATIILDGDEVYRDTAVHEAMERITIRQAQSPRGQVSGTVTDEMGDPVPMAIITAEGRMRGAMTDRSGRFELPSLPTGELSFAVAHPGYQPLGFRLPVLADSTRQLTITLVADPPGVPRE